MVQAALRSLRAIAMITGRSGRRIQTASSLEPIPDDPHHVALGFKYGRTASEWLIIDLQTQSATRLPVSDHLTWSPDRKWFCGAPERALAPYGRGEEFVAPLNLYSSSGQRVRNLTPGTVYTEGADWRRPEQNQNKAVLTLARHPRPTPKTRFMRSVSFRQPTDNRL